MRCGLREEGKNWGGIEFVPNTVGKHDLPISPLVRETRHGKFNPGVSYYSYSVSFRLRE